ncbi:nucleoside deaminase [Aquimarina sp. 2304DJ70-9]|uniref:nucleoside deaminase n=1 Tax=Aquimarina penaris TaxID=3231044 RepID=UPI0034634BC8
MNTHEEYMKYAIKLAQIALLRGDEPAGALVVFKGEVIGTGIESAKTSNNLTNRAEIIAINTAIEFVNADVLKDSFLYSTREPCLMCSFIIRHYKMDRVIYGVPNDYYVGGHTSRIKILETKDIPSWGNAPVITTGVLKDNIAELRNQRFSRVNIN